MEEVASSILASSTPFIAALAQAHASAGCFFGGLVAGEGCYTTSRLPTPRVDGSERLRFVFTLQMAAWDEPLVRALHAFLGVGSLRRAPPGRPGWQPTVVLTVNGRRSHHTATIPFSQHFLPPASAKRRQFDGWLQALIAHEHAHPSRWGTGRSTCSVPGCPDPVRGRGLCRKHYYRATGH